MVKRSETEDNLRQIVDSAGSTREPLSADFYDTALTNSPSSGDSASTPEPEPETPTSSPRKRTSAFPKAVSEDTLNSMDSKSTESVFQDLNVMYRQRLQRNKSKGNVFKSSFADLSADAVPYTILDSPAVTQSQFYGFFILFWLAIAFLILKDALHAIFNDGTSVYEAPVFRIFMTGLPKVAITDGMMYATIYFPYLLHNLCLNGHVSWTRTGWLMESIYEVVYFVFWITYLLVSDFSWIGRIFLVLHMLVLIMKMHSYAFYNGYLWRITLELQFSESYLERLNNNPSILPNKFELANTKKILSESIAFCRFELLHQSVAIGKRDEIDPQTLKRSLDNLQDANVIKFPQNINFKNFFAYTMYPTVVYELVYPRTARIRKTFLFGKILGIFGIISLMLFIAESSIYPLVVESMSIRSSNLTIFNRQVAYFFLLVDMIPPFMVEYLLVFYLIWDAILNAIAEITYFADRDFYGPWWSCVDWFEYARLWNKPVHRFLLRHVYHSSISAFRLNKLQANLVTFLISSFVHELAMYAIFGRVRGYLWVFQMSQIPLVMLSRTRFMKDKKILGNTICWIGFTSGPAIICSLYLVF